jgi:hypothetical protein
MTTETLCRYAGDRDQAIVSYLYDDDGGFGGVERAAFEAHIPACARCCAELAAFAGVRASLEGWAPPEPAGLKTRVWNPARGGGRPNAEAASPERGAPRKWWQEMPLWAQAAAALLFLGAAAGVANVQVQYGAEGLRVRTGWSGAQPGSAAPAGAPEAWRADLVALEERLRAELGQETARAVAAATAAGTANAVSAANAAPLQPELLRRIRALIDESERRQQRELALRVGELMRDVNMQRQSDLARIDRNIGAIQNNTGREMLRQRSDLLNYVTVRTSGRPQQDR